MTKEIIQKTGYYEALNRDRVSGTLKRCKKCNIQYSRNSQKCYRCGKPLITLKEKARKRAYNNSIGEPYELYYPVLLMDHVRRNQS